MVELFLLSVATDPKCNLKGLLVVKPTEAERLRGHKND